MRKIKVNTIKNLLQEECRIKKVPLRKIMFRAAKKAYNQMPWTVRDKVGIISHGTI
jgi:hypothetical protein